MQSGHAEWEGCLEGWGWGWGGRLCPPRGGALNYRLCVSHFLKDSGRRLQQEGPIERAAEASREEGGS